jgi:hypothetical protein
MQTHSLFRVVLACALTTVASAAMSAPIYVGLQAGSGAINTVVNGVNGPATFGLTQFGTTGVYASGSVSGTPPLPEPDLLSTALAVSGEHDTGGTVSIYVSELNQFPLNFSSFFTAFKNTFPSLGSLGAGNQTANTVLQVVESDYVTACTGSPCTSADAFKEGTLLSTATFTSASATTAGGIAPIPGSLTAPYATTEVFTITFAAPSGPNLYGQVSSSIGITVPEPASIALFGSALVGIGAIRRARK